MSTRCTRVRILKTEFCFWPRVTGEGEPSTDMVKRATVLAMLGKPLKPAL